MKRNTRKIETESAARSSADVRECDECGTRFVALPERPNMRYCSNRCEVNHYPVVRSSTSR